MSTHPYFPSVSYHIEHDTFGPIEVPAERLWGAQTQRSLHHFRIAGNRMPRELIYALAFVKKAAALVNLELGMLAKEKAEAIAVAASVATVLATYERYCLW